MAGAQAPTFNPADAFKPVCVSLLLALSLYLLCMHYLYVCICMCHSVSHCPSVRVETQKRKVITAEAREEEAFRMWINSLDLQVNTSLGAFQSTQHTRTRTHTHTHIRTQTHKHKRTHTGRGKSTAGVVDVHLHNLFADCKDGLVC